MVDYGTMLLIGISLGIVFFGMRYYYESKIKQILEIKGKGDEVIGEIIGKYMELIAMNFALTAKLQKYEELCGEITEEEIEENEENEAKATMVKNKIDIISELVKHSNKG